MISAFGRTTKASTWSFREGCVVESSPASGESTTPKQLSAVRRLLEVPHPLEPRIFQRALAGHKVHNGRKKGILFARVPLGHNSISDTVESGKNVTIFEQLFCFYQLVLVV